MERKFNFLKPSNEYFIIVVIFSTITLFFYKHYVVAIISIIVLIAMVVYSYRINEYKRDEWAKFIEGFLNNVDTASKGILVRMPFPLIITDGRGTMLWYNQLYVKEFPDDAVLSSKLQKFLKESDAKKILSSKANIFKDITIKDKTYDIYTSQIETNTDKNNDVLVLYFIDSSEKAKISQELEDKKEAVMLIDVDNFDEVKKSTAEDKKPLLEAEIQRAINSYSQSINAISKQYSTGKYILMTYKKDIENERNKKFEILNQVREIDTGNTLEVTLSIGVSYGGESPLKNYERAFSALELALGRGGDQVVIKDGEKLIFLWWKYQGS